MVYTVEARLNDAPESRVYSARVFEGHAAVRCAARALASLADASAQTDSLCRKWRASAARDIVDRARERGAFSVETRTGSVNCAVRA